eukprot:ANDGO_08614.mRNA.1 hypothetical protein
MRAIDSINNGIRGLQKKRLNFWLYLVVISFTIIGLVTIFAALSSMEWVEMKRPSNDVLIPTNWDTLSIGLSYTRTEYEDIPNATLKYTFVTKTTELFDWFVKRYSDLNCDGQSNKMQSVRNAINGSLGMVIIAIMFQFAAFIIVYLSMQKVRPFKYPNFVSGACYLCAFALYMGQLIYLQTKMNDIHTQSCLNSTMTYDMQILWGQGMVILNMLLMLTCAVCMFFLRKPSANSRAAELKDENTPGAEGFPASTAPPAVFTPASNNSYGSGNSASGGGSSMHASAEPDSSRNEYTAV